MPDRTTALRVEKLRLAWDFTTREMELYKSRYLQLFAAGLAGAVTTVAGVGLGQVPLATGGTLLGVMVAAATYARLRLLALPRRLRNSLQIQLTSFDKFIRGRRP